jgi:hypothetical protein
VNNIGKILIAAFFALIIVTWASPSDAQRGRRGSGYRGHSGNAQRSYLRGRRGSGYRRHSGHVRRSHGFSGFRGGFRSRHGHGHRFYGLGSVVLGSLYSYYPSYPYYPYYYYEAPPVVIQQQAPVYVQGDPEPSSYWYYCRNSQAYYPYVKECPGGWMKVVPEATPPQP